MKSNKFWSIIMMLVLVFGTTVLLSSCGGDDDGDSGSGSSSTTIGGGCSIDNIVGNYTAVTTDGYSTTVTFNNDGSGTKVEKKSGSSQVKNFTYTINGNTCNVRLQHNSSEFINYKVTFVDGFMLFEDLEIGFVDLILYKSGQNLGAPNMKKLIGTWYGENTDTKGNIYTLTCTFNSDGSGHCVNYDGYEKREASTSFTFNALNSFMTICTPNGEKGFFGYTNKNSSTAIILNNKLYFCSYSGFTDFILTKK